MKRFNISRIRTIYLVFCSLFVLVNFSSAQVPDASTIVITVAGMEYSYQPRPDLGYVIRLPASQQITESTNGKIALMANTGAKRIGGLGRRGIWIVEKEQDGGASPTLQSVQKQAQYVAPLFTCFGEKVAVIPEIVVRVTEHIQAEKLQQICRSLGCTIEKSMEFTTQEYLIDVLGPNEDAVFSAVKELNKIDWIDWADLNVAFQPKPCDESGFHAPQVSEISGMIPNDEFLPMQWHLHNTGQFGYTPDADINALEAWDITTGDPNIVIAIVDDGVDANHPDLVNNLVPGYDFLDDDDTTYPQRDNFDNVNNHGTMCAGLAAAQGNNYIGVMGVTWNCKIMPVRNHRTLIGSEDEYDWITNAETATAFRWAADHGADILSNSWGGGSNQIVRSAIIDITQTGGMGRDGKGCIVLAASGNHFDNESTNVRNPAGFRESIAVGATTENDTLRDYSCFGSKVDITAPSGAAGANRSLGIMSTDISGDEGWSQTDYYSGCNGTSTSTPITAGVVALMLSTEPDLTSHEVRHFLTRSARDLGQPGKDDYFGWGRVDARATLDMILAKRADLNDDWKVDDADVALFDELRAANDTSADIGPAPRPDGMIDERDLDLLMQYWGTEIPKMPGSSEPGLIVQWELDETEGTTAHGSYDVYGDAPYPSNVHGGAVWQPEGGIAGGALQLDGVDDYISTPVILDPSAGDFSVFLWIKGGVPGQTIVSQEGGVSWLMADPTDGAMRTNLRTPEVTGRNAKPAGPPLVCSTVVTDGDWHRVGFVRNGSERILYVDDIEVARDTAETLEPAEGGLYIGAASALEPDGFFSGPIDDIRLYNIAVSVE
ncbi:S8 family serine peptidase [Planctomycetota bacterium]